MQRHLMSETATYQVWIEVAAGTRKVDAIELVALRGSPTMHYSAEGSPVVSGKGRISLSSRNLVTLLDSDNLPVFMAFGVEP